MVQTQFIPRSQSSFLASSLLLLFRIPLKKNPIREKKSLGCSPFCWKRERKSLLFHKAPLVPYTLKNANIISCYTSLLLNSFVSCFARQDSGNIETQSMLNSSRIWGQMCCRVPEFTIATTLIRWTHIMTAHSGNWRGVQCTHLLLINSKGRLLFYHKKYRIDVGTKPVPFEHWIQVQPVPKSSWMTINSWPLSTSIRPAVSSCCDVRKSSKARHLPVICIAEFCGSSNSSSTDLSRPKATLLGLAYLKNRRPKWEVFYIKNDVTWLWLFGCNYSWARWLHL